ncbi:hypothetical protein [Algoriphagus sp.]|uniref:glycosyl-4,4'-diaponeurosporenoate acyltransferase CrtO family protein n=1 Tax=Algoriphagus sp. TaxID=1872435 RepID=UPI0025E5C690|nr:hypothetical protein [Algoriphagus sp.]
MKIKLILKKIFLSLGSIFLFYRSYELIINWEKIQSTTNAEILIFSILANLFILGSFALVGFAWPTYTLLPEKYYKIRDPRQLLKFGKKIGVPLFQKFLLLTFWRDQNQRKRYFDGTKSGIRNWIKESKSSEFGHLIPFIILLGLSIWSLLLGFWKIALVNFVLNSVANFYPIVLQRMHRARINKIIARI